MRCLFTARCTVLRLQWNFFSASAIAPLPLPASFSFITNSAISYSRVSVLAEEGRLLGRFLSSRNTSIRNFRISGVTGSPASR